MDFTADNRETAEVLNKFFQSVYITEDTEDIPGFTDVVSDENALGDLEIDEPLIRTELRNLQEGKAAGPDGIPSTLLKQMAEPLAKPLKHLFEKSLQEGKLPKEWKSAVITPIFKKGSKKKAGNYRPVSLTSQTCKVLERIILKHIMGHLGRHNLISRHQHGFLRGRSCQTNLLEAFEMWTRWLDEGNNVDIVYLDYQKAFDRVPHLRLLNKLHAYGIRGQTLRWVQDFLINRTQQVSVGKSLSQPAKVASGVPQGSVLGPTLFIIYINELPEIVQSECKLFADDTKLFRSITTGDDSKVLQADLDKLSEWSGRWLLTFNVEKCKTMHCGQSNPRVDYFMRQNDTEPKILTSTNQERDLGVIVTSNLKASSHCLAASKKAMTALRLLKMAFYNLDSGNFKALYTTYVRPHLDYCLPAVGPYMVQDIQRLEKVQRRATKLVTEIRTLPYPERLKLLNIPSMEDRLKRGDLIEAFKILTGKVDIDAGQFFEYQEDARTRGHHLKLKKRRSSHHYRNMFFANRVVNPWNDLPANVISAPTVNAFKKRLDQFWATLA